MGCSTEDLPEAMNDREEWWERVRDICAGGTTLWWWWVVIDQAKISWTKISAQIIFVNFAVCIEALICWKIISCVLFSLHNLSRLGSDSFWWYVLLLLCINRLFILFLFTQIRCGKCPSISWFYFLHASLWWTDILVWIFHLTIRNIILSIGRYFEAWLKVSRGRVPMV